MAKQKRKETMSEKDGYEVKNAEIIGRVTIYKTALGYLEFLAENMSDEEGKNLVKPQMLLITRALILA